MATGAEALSMIYPDGGWAISGDDFEGITFIEAKPITKKEFEEAKANYDNWKANKDKIENNRKELILNKLGISIDELKILLNTIS